MAKATFDVATPLTIDVWRAAFRDSSTGIYLGDLRRTSLSESVVAGNAGTSGSGIMARTIGSTENASTVIDRVEINGNEYGRAVSGTGTVMTVVNATNSSISKRLATGLNVGNRGDVRLAGTQVTGNQPGVAVGGTGGVASLGNKLEIGNQLADAPPLMFSPY